MPRSCHQSINSIGRDKVTGKRKSVDQASTSNRPLWSNSILDSRVYADNSSIFILCDVRCCPTIRVVQICTGMTAQGPLLAGWFGCAPCVLVYLTAALRRSARHRYPSVIHILCRSLDFEVTPRHFFILRWPLISVACSLSLIVQHCWLLHFAPICPSHKRDPTSLYEPCSLLIFLRYYFLYTCAGSLLFQWYNYMTEC